MQMKHISHFLPHAEVQGRGGGGGGLGWSVVQRSGRTDAGKKELC